MRTCIDLFSGCGGLSLGLEMAGFKPLLFSEINKEAATTYKANRSKEIIEIGDIYTLQDKQIATLKAKWKNDGIQDVDVVAGGPPCQGYSGIGYRRTFNLDKQDIPSNQLYQEMIRVVIALNPRIFLFENVGGLLTAKWKKGGEKGEIFRDVLQSFINIKGYTVRWDYVQSKNYGVPQNRPRVLLVGIREDLRFSIPSSKPSISTIIKPTAISDGLLPQGDSDYPDIIDLLSDLCDPNYKNGGIIDTYTKNPSNRFQEHLRTTLSGKLMGKGASLTEHVFSNHAPRIVKKFSYMIKNDSKIPKHMQTKKFAQRVLPRKWGNKGPSITATSMPDDYVHYSQPRTLSVREWARLQMFPDWYLFKGPRTTGGRRRAGDPSTGHWYRDVPKYTQIGNAVPVELARRIGMHFATLLKQA